MLKKPNVDGTKSLTKIQKKVVAHAKLSLPPLRTNFSSTPLVERRLLTAERQGVVMMNIVPTHR